MAFNPSNPNGSATSANSAPVVIASDQATIPVSAASLPLPTGGSTATKQDTGNTSLASIDGKITAVNTGAVVVSSSALPTGGSTAAKQDTGNTSVASIDTKIPALGQALAAASVPVVLTAAQVTTLTPPAAITGFALDATLTGGTQKAKITDGTNDATVKAASTAAGATDKALVVAVSPNNSVAVTGTFFQATQPVSGTVTTTPPSNASTNVAQLAGTTTDTNSGTKSAGTLRVVIATDQPALTNKLLVTPDSVALPANQSVNVSQINGVTTLMGNGVTGTGSQRVTIASDSTPHQVSASNETASVYNGTTALTPKFATIVASSSGATTIVALVSSKKIRVLAMQLVANAAVNVKWQSHVTPTDKTGLAYLAANGGYVLPFSPVGWFETVSGEALDINLSGAVAVGGSLTYIEV